MQNALTYFLSEYRGQPLNVVQAALTELIAEGGGIVTKPLADPEKHIRPATADYEIEALGVYARGHSMCHAVHNWMKVAEKVANPQEAA